MKKTIPIFPLKLVMFPQSFYKLHIFEERYKRMIKRCLDNKESFGILSKIEMTIATVGCKVKVDKVLMTYENGSMDILVKGEEKFKTLKTSLHEDGYLTAEIAELYDDEPTIENYEYENIIMLFKQILDKINLNLSNEFWENLASADLKSYKIAEKSGLTLKQQQNLLNLKSEDERLEFLHYHLENLDRMVERGQILKDIIIGDGYINEKT